MKSNTFKGDAGCYRIQNMPNERITHCHLCWTSCKCAHCTTPISVWRTWTRQEWVGLYPFSSVMPFTFSWKRMCPKNISYFGDFVMKTSNIDPMPRPLLSYRRNFTEYFKCALEVNPAYLDCLCPENGNEMVNSVSFPWLRYFSVCSSVIH